MRPLYLSPSSDSVNCCHVTQTFAASQLTRQTCIFFPQKNQNHKTFRQITSFKILAFPSPISDAILQDAHENGDGKPASVSCFAN